MIETETDKKILEEIKKYQYDPMGFIKFAFPWGVAGTKLEQESPEHPVEDWAEKMFRYIGENLKTSKTATKIAIRAGHSVAKSCSLSLLILWFMSTRPNPQIVATANTKTQLTSKTWRELAIWHKLAINRDWFEWAATQFYLKTHKATWCANAIPWSKDRPESFAGVHARNVLFVFDEASSIDNKIWEVTEGAMTYGECLWVVAGNPTRTSGEFFECFNSKRSLWKGYEVDSRTCKHANQNLIKEWVDFYGEDSDFVRVRVRGLPPAKGINQIITPEKAAEARQLKFHLSQFGKLPKIMGVDVARFGDDETAIAIRQGLVFTHLETYSQLDTTALANLISRKMIVEKVSACFIDLGYNPGVFDVLKKMGHNNVYGVHFGSNSYMSEIEQKMYANMAAMMYLKLREHIENGGNLPDDQKLIDELVAREYSYNQKGLIILERKEDVKRRLGRSPDRADACCLTFADETKEHVDFPRAQDHETEFGIVDVFDYLNQ